MKKTVSLISAAVLIFMLCLPITAASCNHDYEAEHFAADCLSAEHTVYTCKECGDTYTKYAAEYDAPESFTFAFESEKDEAAGTVTLTARLFANPGLSIAIMEVAFNDKYLTPKSFVNGEIWETSELNLGREINLDRRPLKIYAERVTDEINYKNGVYFTVIFDINPDSTTTDYGFAFTLRNNDFLNAVTGEKFVPRALDMTGKKDLGDHAFIDTVTPPTCTEGGDTLHTCEKCGYTFTDSETLPLGHNVENTEIVHSPTFTEEGLSTGVCTRCGESIETVIPVLERWQKGDLNNDGKVNASDGNLMKRVVIGTYGASSLQINDAADINGDGKSNSVDLNLMRRIITGTYIVS